MHDAVLPPDARAYSDDSRPRAARSRLALPARQRRLLASAAAAALLAGATGALSYTRRSAAEPSAEPARPVAVAVQTVSEQSVRLWSEFSGRLKPVDSAELRPEVSGRITEVRFEDGQAVLAGDVLFVIDPRPYEAAVAKSEASVAAARTNLAFATTELGRATELVKMEAIAQQLYDQLANAHRVAEAAVRTAAAELKQAQLDLEHAHVKAPISGRVSRAEVTLGNLVQAGPGAPVLASIVSNGGIYADFEVDEQTYLSAIRSHARGNEQERRIPVELTLKADRTRSYAGTIQAFDNRIDSASGTIRARAKFSNTDGVLVPGMFVSVRLGSGDEHPVLLVAERAVGTDQSKKFVYVVGSHNQVGYREVELGPAIEGQRVVVAGLQPGDRVIVDGMQHVRPDVVVEPTEVSAVTTAHSMYFGSQQ
jgi:multidrug efflux system membrane fusion protein